MIIAQYINNNLINSQIYIKHHIHYYQNNLSHLFLFLFSKFFADYLVIINYQIYIMIYYPFLLIIYTTFNLDVQEVVIQNNLLYIKLSYAPYPLFMMNSINLSFFSWIFSIYFNNFSVQILFYQICNDLNKSSTNPAKTRNIDKF